MALFREQDRLVEDWRMLRIYDPKDFALYKFREELNFLGIVYDYSLSKHFIAANAVAIPAGLQAECETTILTGTREDEQGLAYMDKRLGQEYFPKTYRPVAMDLFRYRELSQINTNGCSQITLRFNSHYPYYASSPDHYHEAILTLSVKGHSTVLRNEEGAFYKPRNGDVVLIGDNMRHWAPEPTLKEPERATFAVD